MMSTASSTCSGCRPGCPAGSSPLPSGGCRCRPTAAAYRPPAARRPKPGSSPPPGARSGRTQACGPARSTPPCRRRALLEDGYGDPRFPTAFQDLGASGLPHPNPRQRSDLSPTTKIQGGFTRSQRTGDPDLSPPQPAKPLPGLSLSVRTSTHRDPGPGHRPYSRRHTERQSRYRLCLPASVKHHATHGVSRRRIPLTACNWSGWDRTTKMHLPVPGTSCRGPSHKRDCRCPSPVRPSETKRGAFCCSTRALAVHRVRPDDVLDASALTRNDVRLRRVLWHHHVPACICQPAAAAVVLNVNADAKELRRFARAAGSPASLKETVRGAPAPWPEVPPQPPPLPAQTRRTAPPAPRPTIPSGPIPVRWTTARFRSWRCPKPPALPDCQLSEFERGTVQRGWKLLWNQSVR